MNYLITSTSNNPYFNLALEEVLFNNFEHNYFLLYINNPSVICGKHQIPYKECNIELAENNNVAICRRFSGGGTVFHDTGNLNFCFIENNDNKGLLVDFKKFTQPIVDFLLYLGLQVSTNERNNILINGKKISGNAQHLAKNRTLHHGTLLFDTDIHLLQTILNVDASNYQDRSVQSVRADVTNIKPFLKTQLSIENFQNMVAEWFISKLNYTGSILSNQTLEKVKNLMLSKYITKEWIFGYSPKYMLKKQTQSCEIHLEVEKGIIQSCNIICTKSEFSQALSNAIIGKPHQIEEIRNILIKLPSEITIFLKQKSIDVYSFF